MSRVALSDVARRVVLAVRQIGRSEPNNDASADAVKRVTGVSDSELSAAWFELNNAGLIPESGQVGCIGLNARGIELADRLSGALPPDSPTSVYVTGAGHVVQTVVASPGATVVAAGRDANISRTLRDHLPSLTLTPDQHTRLVAMLDEYDRQGRAPASASMLAGLRPVLGAILRECGAEALADRLGL